MKIFEITYRCEVKRSCTVEAKNEAEARKKFDNGDIDDERDLDCYDIDDVCINET